MKLYSFSVHTIWPPYNSATGYVVAADEAQATDLAKDSVAWGDERIKVTVEEIPMIEAALLTCSMDY